MTRSVGIRAARMCAYFIASPLRWWCYFAIFGIDSVGAALMGFKEKARYWFRLGAAAYWVRKLKAFQDASASGENLHSILMMPSLEDINIDTLYYSTQLRPHMVRLSANTSRQCLPLTIFNKCLISLARLSLFADWFLFELLVMMIIAYIWHARCDEYYMRHWEANIFARHNTKACFYAARWLKKRLHDHIIINSVDNNSPWWGWGYICSIMAVGRSFIRQWWSGWHCQLHPFYCSARIPDTVGKRYCFRYFIYGFMRPQPVLK